MHEDRKSNKYRSNSHQPNFKHTQKVWQRKNLNYESIEVKQKVNVQKKTQMLNFARNLVHNPSICFAYAHKNWYTSWTDPIMAMKTEDVDYNMYSLY